MKNTIWEKGPLQCTAQTQLNIPLDSLRVLENCLPVSDRHTDPGAPLPPPPRSLICTRQATGQFSSPCRHDHRWLCRGPPTLPTAKVKGAGLPRAAGKSSHCCHKKGESLIKPILPPSALLVPPLRRGSGHRQDQHFSKNTPCLKDPVGPQGLICPPKPGRRSASGQGVLLSLRGTGGAPGVCLL